MLRPLPRRRFLYTGLGLLILLGFATPAVVTARLGRVSLPSAGSIGRSVEAPVLALNANQQVATHVESPPGADGSRAVGSARLRSGPHSTGPALWDGWSTGLGGTALVLAVCGGIACATRWFFPQAAAGDLQVVGRVSLSPKHTVYLLRVRGRELLVGAGPQGAPALLTELDDPPAIELNTPQGGEP
jgi:hypothetical protein